MMRTEKEKMLAGEYYKAFDEELDRDRQRAKELLHKLNSFIGREHRKEVLQELLGSTKDNFVFETNFYCDYGYNIHIGENFFANVGCTILDCARVTIGDNVLLAPYVGIYTATHPIDAEERNSGLEYACPICIGNNVWIGGGAVILPGVTIGDNAVIGAGSVVTRNIAANSLAVGNPCRVIRNIEQKKEEL